MSPVISFDNSPFFVPAAANTNDTYDLQVDINSYVTVIFVDDYDIKEPQKQYLYVIISTLAISDI